MKYFIPTYEQAQEIVNNNNTFYESVDYIDGYKISMFNYRLSKYDDFIKPIDNKDYNGIELRGLTFVFNKDGSLYKRYILLNKFWNINQVEETQLDLLRNKKIKHIHNKEDGSLITFIMLPDNSIIAKTKMSLVSEQAKESLNILNKNNNMYNFVKDMLNKNYSLMFEYTSFKNKVVLNYDKDNLTLLKVRDNDTGEYIDIEQFRYKGFNVVDSDNHTFDELLNLKDTLTNKEGWVITFDDGYMVKLKTKWYTDKHHLNDSLMYENVIISMILNETIDDVISQLNVDYDKEKIDYIDSIITIVSNKVVDITSKINILLDDYNGDKKEFALKYLKNEYFGLVVQVIKGFDIYDVVKKHILKITNKQLKARNFLFL